MILQKELEKKNMTGNIAINIRKAGLSRLLTDCSQVLSVTKFCQIVAQFHHKVRYFQTKVKAKAEVKASAAPATASAPAECADCTAK